LRLLAVLFWLIAIAFEAAVILLFNGTLYIPGNEMVYLVGGIVLILIFVIIGSQFWKKANRIDPVSKKNKLKFYLWNQMGLIAAESRSSRWFYCCFRTRSLIKGSSRSWP
jgi:hypothetical protein